MYLGRLIEWGPTERVYEAPRHPYTKALLDASPVPDPAKQRQRHREPPKGEPPDHLSAGVGCPFASRCLAVMDVCRLEMPPPTDVATGGGVRCHLESLGAPVAPERPPYTRPVPPVQGATSGGCDDPPRLH
jgi:oligopeptide/dipeptide ABC transporter ATP-binding protein